MNSQIDKEEIVYGNYEDKYHTRNPFLKSLVGNFLRRFYVNLSLIPQNTSMNVCEVGCAEGELLKITRKVFPKANIFATDLSEGELMKAKDNCRGLGIYFSVQNAEDLRSYNDAQFDLVICCEVLEHLQNPSDGLKELCRISRNYILVSVPNEPIWRLLNMARGKYLAHFGNTPGHLNHWNVFQFLTFLQDAPDWQIVKRSYPFPWQMILIKKTI